MSTATTEQGVHSAVLRGEPVEAFGLKWYALQMNQYEVWQSCKSVLLARQSTFPVSCVAMPYLEALFTMELAAVVSEGQPAGIMYNIMYIMSRSLRMPDSSVKDQTIRIECEGEKLLGIRVNTEENSVLISTQEFDTVRKILAWENGDAPPDESLNDELLEAERDISDQNTPNLKYSLDDLMASVAVNIGKRIRDIEEYSILEFELTRQAVDRSKRHLICALSQGFGSKWEGGNPAPSWCYDRKENGSRALVSFNRFKNAQNT